MYIIDGLCGSCQASAGYKYDSVNKKCVWVCGLNEIYVNNQCVCERGYNKINGVCRTCPAGKFFNFVSQSCESAVICGDN